MLNDAFIHLGYFYSASSGLYYSETLQTQHGKSVPEFHAEAPQATVSKGLAQDPYVAARAGVKPKTLRTKGVDSTKVPPHPTLSCVVLTASVVFELVPINKLNKFRFKSLL